MVPKSVAVDAVDEKQVDVGTVKQAAPPTEQRPGRSRSAETR